MFEIVATALTSSLAWMLVGFGLAFACAGRLLLTVDRRDPRPAMPRWARAYLAVTVLAALALRVWLSARFQLEDTESYSLMRACEFTWDGHERTAEGLYHPPLQPLMVRTFLGLDAAHGWHLDRLGIRIPSLVLGVASQVLLARVGVLLRAPLAGLAAATLLGFGGLSIRVALPQENYIIEQASALWFAERCLQYLLWRRPVYGTLAAAAAAALWSGYMNVPLLGIGALTLGAAAVARRDRRPALFTALAAALLIAPIASSFVRAGRSYTSISVSAGANPDEAARRANEARHPVLYVEGSFSRGRADRAVLAFTDGLLGRQSYLFFAGALVLLLWQRWRALPLLALLAAFPLLGMRMLLNAQNYASVIPFYLLTITWGVEGLALALFRDAPERAWRLTAPLQAVAVALTLWGGYERAPLFSYDAGRRFFFFRYMDLAPLRRALAQSPPDMPVLYYNLVKAPVFQHEICAADQPACQRTRCGTQGDYGLSDVEGSPWEILQRAQRETATPRRSYIGVDLDTSLVEGLGALYDRPAWTRGSLVLRDRERPSSHAVEALDRLLNRHCSRVALEPGYLVLRCSAEQAAALRADAARPQSLLPSAVRLPYTSARR